MDRIFSQEPNAQFEFNAAVAGVFDDMVNRSVPFYAEILRLGSELALEYLCAQEPQRSEAAIETKNIESKNIKRSAITKSKNKRIFRILDLGTSTANTLLEIAQIASSRGLCVHLIGIDSSDSMLKIAEDKLAAYDIKQAKAGSANITAELLCGDICDIALPNADLVVANFTLQFVRPISRFKLCAKIAECVNSGGLFWLSEKICSQNTKLDKIFINKYLKTKKSRGYSEFEISKKREALENVLVPFSENENQKMLIESGFSSIETIFRWVNFASFFALKEMK